MREAAYQSTMQLLPLGSAGMDCDRKCSSCRCLFQLIRGAERIKMLQEKVEGFMELEFLLSSLSSSAHVAFATVTTLSQGSCSREAAVGIPSGARQGAPGGHHAGSCWEIALRSNGLGINLFLLLFL